MKYTLLLLAISLQLVSQDSIPKKLIFDLPLVDLPQNTDLPYTYPGMNQALNYSNAFYELSFFGLRELGNLMVPYHKEKNGKARKHFNQLLKYGLCLGFSKYGSELPIPLGVWGHEEYHRSVLGVNKIRSYNGNWILHRWDGTVYGVHDSVLGELKSNNPQNLLYAYVSGIQYEVHLNEINTKNNFFNKREASASALLLYNAYYVFNYFSFASGPFSDTVKHVAPKYENKSSTERDFAGADLTAWVYDMYNPEQSYTSRDKFPDGEGVNRRVGFSDLTEEAQSYLLQQKKLSLLNFINPSIFLIHRIKIGNKFSFLPFMQYAPTHFGSDISVIAPFKINELQFCGSWHMYNNQSHTGYGLDLSILNLKLSKKWLTDVTIKGWDQPDSFFSNQLTPGGSADLRLKYKLNHHFQAYTNIHLKSKGWEMGDPYLKQNGTVRLGMSCIF